MDVPNDTPVGAKADAVPEVSANMVREGSFMLMNLVIPIVESM